MKALNFAKISFTDILLLKIFDYLSYAYKDKPSKFTQLLADDDGNDVIEKSKQR